MYPLFALDDRNDPDDYYTIIPNHSALLCDKIHSKGPCQGLATIPSELRLKIFDYLPEEVDAFGGHDPNNLWCRELQTVRPPVLVRVSRVLRNEYLQLFFATTTFRMNADVDCVINNVFTEDDPNGPRNPFAFAAPLNYVAGGHQSTPSEKVARAWLSSIGGAFSNERELVMFRHIIYNPITKHGVPLGFTLEVHFRRRAYQIDVYRNEGWVDVYDMVARGGLKALFAPDKIVEILEEACRRSRDEVLDWDMVTKLEDTFGRHDGYDADWFGRSCPTFEAARAAGMETAEMLPEEWWDALRAEDRHCFSKEVPLLDEGASFSGVRDLKKKEAGENSDGDEGSYDGDRVPYRLRETQG
ncbi:uncharacterized protein LTR77_006413 [Saxophila tyrrhenica]|uniref:F-box domain-containing protein n=1 Tax=Saxophila tyrrhenica TaxID=1690608 RepID=A0AAV9PBA2_9PEZI|nr:hypothetical protein LTR77_006413 [Saxophila tyrrhenica]